MNPTKLWRARLTVPTERKRAIRELEQNLRKHNGNLLQTAKSMGILHRTICRWIEESRELRDMLAKVRESVREKQ